MSSSDSKTPVYDKSHYSWKAPSSQASQLIIDHTTETSTGTPTPSSPVREVGFADLADKELESPPVSNRRSTSNYQQESERFRNANIPSSEERQGGGPGPQRPISKRTKSWDYRDKRGQMQMSQLDQSTESAEGFSEA